MKENVSVKERTEAARELREEAKRWRAKADSAHSKEHGLASAYRADAAAMREIAKLLRAGDIRMAAAKTHNLDTLVRDLLPDSVWEIICYG